MILIFQKSYQHLFLIFSFRRSRFFFFTHPIHIHLQFCFTIDIYMSFCFMIFTCQFVSSYIFTCHCVSSYIFTCHFVSSYIFIYNFVSPYISACHCVSSYIFTCYYVSSYIITCHLICFKHKNRKWGHHFVTMLWHKVNLNMQFCNLFIHYVSKLFVFLYIIK